MERAEESEPLTLSQLRRGALLQDVLLFCCAFTAGALAYGLGRGMVALLTDRTDSFWTIGLSDDLILAGLVGGELFVLWNNGLRQGLRGHSIGKHRGGIEVVDRRSGRPTGALRGLVRGLVVVALLDLAIAAIPLGLPTVARRATPDSWHLGFAAYLALALLVIPVVLSWRHRDDRTDRLTLGDQLAGTEVVRSASRTSRRRGRVVDLLDVAGVAGMLGLAVAYIVFFSPLIRFPGLF